MNYSLTFISAMVADQFDKQLPGCPTENRVLILSPKEVNQTRSGLIIPEQVKEGVPRKGVIVKLGEITEEYRTYRELVQIGRIVTYGLYAGKEMEFETEKLSPALQQLLEKNTLTVLSMNEVIYSEPNNND
jgi:co-chaperonin GroES (HSP10)|nr:MAG TPA: co-chaperonin [Caudoviricetes sp.]